MTSKYQFLLIPPFKLPDQDQFTVPGYSLPTETPKEQRLLNNDFVLSHFEDVNWELHPGAEPPYGNWSVESRKKFAYATTARMKGVREACESGKYNGIILLGGGEPGVPVT